MSKFITIIAAIIFFFSCDDEDFSYLEYNKHFKIINQSSKNISVLFYRYQTGKAESFIPDSDTLSMGLIKDSILNSHILLNSDSIIFTFPDNKKLKYYRNQCQNRNLICENSFECTKPTGSQFSFCTYVITSEDYKNAK